MAKSSIEWTNWTSNPVGIKGSRANYCVKISDGCRNCYAEIMSRRLAAISHDRGFVPYKAMKVPPELELRQHVLDQWKKWTKPRLIFVSSMSDVFGEFIPKEWVFAILTAMRDSPLQTFQVLTKRSQRAKELVDEWCELNGLRFLPINIWIGASVEDQKNADERIPWLAQTKCHTRFLSCEPLLGRINLGLIGTCPKDWGYGYRPVGSLLHQVIVGGESGHKARPMHPHWAKSLRDQCIEADVPFFFKQWGQYAEGSNPSVLQKNHYVVLSTGAYSSVNKIDIIKEGKTDSHWNRLHPAVMTKVGKHGAGNELDGVVYAEFPKHYGTS